MNIDLEINTMLTSDTKIFEGKYTTISSRSALHARVAKRDLNRHLGADY